MIKTFTAFKYRNYRLWFSGQLVSLIGTWMQGATLGYFVFELTKSPAYLGYVTFATGLPSWIFMLYAGVMTDRVSRRTLLLVTQSIMAFLALVLSLLTFSHLIQPWQIVALSFLTGIPQAFDAPARQSFVIELVEKDDLTNAIALNSMLFNSSMILGPAMGGVVYAIWGPAWCFLVNALSFLMIIINLSLMRISYVPSQKTANSALSDIIEGFRYIYSEKLIMVIMFIVVSLTIFGMSFMTLIPAWVIKILHGDSRIAGLLQSARGIGAVVVAIGIASLGRFTFKGKLLSFGTLALPVLLFIFALTNKIYFSLTIMFFIGASLIMIMNLANALIQILVVDRLRGRVMSVYSLTFFGFMPVGGLLVGFMAEHFGEPHTIMICSSIFFCIAIFVQIISPQLRRK